MPFGGRQPQAMIRKADGQYEVAVGMLKRSSRCKASERTILRKLHNRSIYFRETRPACLARLRRTAFALLIDVVSSAVADMKRRCATLAEANGGNIEEGGGM